MSTTLHGDKCANSTANVVGSVANNWNNFRLFIPQSELEGNNYLYVNSTTQRCPNKIIKTFLIEDFLYLPQVSTTLVVHLEL
jgi:hypothetical protein